MDEPDDNSLVLAVAKRDRDAFAVLYERHARICLGLAQHLTGSQALAEEAVQEAMLRIWQLAHLYRTGNARAWILKIVAHESTRIIRSSRRMQKQEATVYADVKVSPSREG